MHHAKIEKSPRLQKTLAVLARGGWWSTREIMLRTDSCNVSTDISELRRNGYEVECESQITTQGDGRRIFMYRLVEPPVPREPKRQVIRTQADLFS